MTFLSKIFGSFAAQPSPHAPEGYRAYAVGDIHGRLDLLDELLAKIQADIKRRQRSQNLVVFLGDLIDRGPHSAQVIERLRTWKPRDADTIFLCGNHEEVLLRVLAGEPAILGDWLKFGGVECLASYGLSAAELDNLEEPAALAAVKAAVPAEHQSFLASFADTFRFGDYLFVHAGIPRAGRLLRRHRKTCAGSATRSWTTPPITVSLSSTGIPLAKRLKNAPIASASTPEPTEAGF